MIEIRQRHQALRDHRRRRPAQLRGSGRRGHRLPRPERRRQVHHDADDGRARPAHLRPGHDQRPPLRRPAVPAAPRRCPARSPSDPSRTQRPQPPALAGRLQRDRPPPGRRGPRTRRSGERRRPPLGRVLARDGPTPRHRHRPARRPGHPAPRRTRQRTRPRGHPMDPPAPPVPRSRGTVGPGVEPPDERDGVDRRPSHRRRQGSAHRRGHRRRGRAVQLDRVRPSRDRRATDSCNVSSARPAPASASSPTAHSS